MNRFSIKDIENLTGIKAHTLRIWEQRYNIITPKRTDTNIRYYTAEDLKQALAVALLNQYGYKISHISNMNNAEVNKIITESSDQNFKLDALVNEMLNVTISMDILNFEQILDSYISDNNIEETVEQLIFRYLDKVGILWMTNKISTAQEHLTSNVISRKLQVAIDQFKNSSPNKTSVLLFLPEGEFHDLGLLYACYILLKNNKHTIYLGANTPLDQVALVCNRLQPDYIYTHLTSVSRDFNSKTFIKNITSTFDSNKVLISGSMLKNIHLDTGVNKPLFLQSLNDTKSTLINLV